jgi:hypothetical protein
LYELETADSSSVALVLRLFILRKFIYSLKEKKMKKDTFSSKYQLISNFIADELFRAIYDSGDVYKFGRELERRIAQYDKNILKMCTYHYQEFLDSVGQLKSVKDRCDEIKVLFIFTYSIF